MSPCIVSIFQYISNKMQPYTFYLYLETALHISGSTSTHHQERIQLYLQHLVFVDTVVCVPDDGWKYYPKHVEQFPDINKLYNVSSCWIFVYTGILLRIHYILHISRIRVKQQNLPFHPPYCTTACSQPLATHNFCLQTVPNCEVNFQLRRYRRLTTSSFTPSSHSIIGVPSGRLQAN
jgi:hypothetical protein